MAKAKGGRRQSLKKASAAPREAAARYPRCTMAVVNCYAAAEAAEEKRELEQRVLAWTPGTKGRSAPCSWYTGPGLIGIGVCERKPFRRYASGRARVTEKPSPSAPSREKLDPSCAGDTIDQNEPGRDRG